MSETPEQPSTPPPAAPDAPPAQPDAPAAVPAKRTRAAKAAAPAKAARPAKAAAPDPEAAGKPAKKATASRAPAKKAVPAAAQPVDTQPVDAQPVDAQPVATVPAQSQPIFSAPPGTAPAIQPVPPQPPVATAPPGVPVPPQPVAYPAAATGYWTNPPGVVRRPPPPGFIQTRWKGPQRASDLIVLLGILLGGLGFALALPLSRPGIGWPIAGIVAALGVGYAAWRSDATVTRADRVMRIVWGIAALAMLAMSAIRASGLLTFYFVIGALACASLAAAGGKSVRAMAFGIVSVPIAGFRSIPWVAQSIKAIAARRAERAKAAGHDADAAAIAARTRRNSNIVISAVITLVLLLIFGALFASADAVFAHYLDAFFGRIGKVLPDLDAGNLILRLFLLAVGLLITAGGVFLATVPPDLRGMESPGRPVLGRDLLMLPLAGLALLFVGFVAVQFTALFGGNTYVLKHSQVDYAEYAVGGFTQLVVVSLLTLAIVAAAARWGHKELARDRVTLQILLGLLCVLSIVIVVSALTRLQLYVDTYGLTRERFAVAMLELFLGMMFLLILLAGYRMQASWLPRAVLGVWVVMLLGAGALNPEHYIAQHNIARYQAGEKIDLYYLGAMSADAVPVLINLPERERNCVLGGIDRDLRNEPDDWYEWNWGREEARSILREKFPHGFGVCQGRRGYDYQSR
jgi:hypothetical protein